MIHLTRHLQLPDILILLGVVLLAIGLYGYTQFFSTLVACYPEPTIWDVRLTHVTLQSIGYTDGCNVMWGPSYAVLWPVGIAVSLLGGGFKSVRSFARGNITRGVGIVLMGIGLVTGAVSIISTAVFGTVASLLVIGVGIAIVVVGWVRDEGRQQKVKLR